MGLHLDHEEFQELADKVLKKFGVKFDYLDSDWREILGVETHYNTEMEFITILKLDDVVYQLFFTDGSWSVGEIFTAKVVQKSTKTITIYE